MLFGQTLTTDGPRRHFTAAELDARLAAASTPRDGAIIAIVLRRGDQRHELPTQAPIAIEHGLAGDRWAAMPTPDPEAQLSLIDVRVARALVDDAAELHVPGDNLVVDLDLAEDALAVGAQLDVGGVRLEITGKPHTGCAKFSARLGSDALRWVNAPDGRRGRRRGVFARVLSGGVLAVGDRLVRR